MKWSRVLAVLCATAGTAAADEIIVPNAAATTAGSGGYSTLLRSAARSYQLVVGSGELGALPQGSRITGITWRRPTWQVHAAWPGVGFSCVFANYDITLSTSSREPGNLSTTYTDNIGPDAVLVRSGPMTFADAFFPGGALTPATNDFGEIVPFTTPYVYQGGTLLLTVRHDGNNCGGSGSLDTVSSAQCQAIGVSSYTQPDQWYAQGPIVMRLTFEAPAPCDPDVNCDGAVNGFDIQATEEAVNGDFSNFCQPSADLNGDGTENGFDIEAEEQRVNGAPC
ncbi:hypothetical protein PHYC_03404 [Phycisphaerales bacterium]|nr:hypothetical protein PHYC_03404 [Phycisphaerales bacterium]